MECIALYVEFNRDAITLTSLRRTQKNEVLMKEIKMLRTELGMKKQEWLEMNQRLKASVIPVHLDQRSSFLDQKQ